jgi:hypothetical protein
MAVSNVLYCHRDLPNYRRRNLVIFAWIKTIRGISRVLSFHRSILIYSGIAGRYKFSIFVDTRVR